MIGSPGETVLPRRSKSQPHPEIHKGGDCGACALAGALDFEVKTVYEAFDSKGITNYGEMGRCLRVAAHHGFADRILDSAPDWDCYTGRSFGKPAYYCYLQWFNYIRMAVDAGYYGVAMVNYDCSGEPETNHWILICGARTKGAVHGETITGDVLISCSVRGEQWYEARDFLKRMGGYDALLLHPAQWKVPQRQQFA